MENHQSKGSNESTSHVNGSEKSDEVSNTSVDMENITRDFSAPSPKDINKLVLDNFNVCQNDTIENYYPLVHNDSLNGTTDMAVSLHSPTKSEENKAKLSDEGEKKVEKENKLSIEKECFGLIQDIIVEKVNNIIQKIEEKEIREESPEFDIYEPKSDSDDDYRFPDSFVTIDECESDYSIASEEEINASYQKEYFKKDNSINDDEDVLVLDTEDENEDIDFGTENKRKIDTVLEDSNESLTVEITGKLKSTQDIENPPKKFKTFEENNNTDDDKLFEEPTNIKITISNNDSVKDDSPYSITDGTPTNENPSPKPTFPNLEITVKNKKFIPREEVEYVSQDPQENADNNNEEWQTLKLQIGNEAERYRAIRDRWRNLSIPNPNINLTYRHVNNPGLNSNEKKNYKKNNPGFKNHQRSHSCTSFYENIISQLNSKLDAEKQKVIDQHNVDLFRTQMMLKNELNAAVCAAQNPRNIHAQQNLRLTQYRQNQTLQQLQNSCQTSIEQLENEHMEQVELYEQYMEEVRAFNSFYRGLTVQNDHLELTDEQYEHLAETERMYMVFRDFYE